MAHCVLNCVTNMISPWENVTEFKGIFFKKSLQIMRDNLNIMKN